MMIAPLFAWALLIQQQGPSPVRLKVGDTVSLFVATAPPVSSSAEKDSNPFSRTMAVQSDGAIYGIGFGRLKVSGLTVEEAEKSVRRGLKKLFREEDVFLTLIKQRVNIVYIVGANATGPVEMPADGAILSQLLPPAGKDLDVQRLDVQLTRDGKVVGRASYTRALSGEDALGRIRLQPNDLISVLPQESVRVWVLGPVKNPGLLVLPKGSTPYEAVAAAGGIESFEPATRLALRHGPDTTEFPARPDPRSDTAPLSEGDVITVMAPEALHVAIAGKVTKPDDYVVNSGTTLLQLVSKANGLLPEASYSRVFLFRNGESVQYDFSALANGGKIEDPLLKAGDLVYVDENRRVFYVFGHASKSGRFLMDDGKTYRATDALALAGGLDTKGSMRSVVLYHANPNGKPTITIFNLDEYLKDGKLAANPELQPGDALLFSEPKGLNIGSLSQIFSAYFFLNTIRR